MPRAGLDSLTAANTDIEPLTLGDLQFALQHLYAH